MTPLGKILLRQIAATGPISLAEYMNTCLMHPQHGYYTTRDPLGAKGDFTTSPEISQMFGELLGLCLVQTWLVQGQPRQFTLAELGPGRGTLMADIMRATRQITGFQNAARIHLVEASPVLRNIQKQTLSDYNPTWTDSAENLPPGPLFLVANEFFDALPIRQFSRDAQGWREHMIAAQDGRLTVALADAAPVTALDHRLADTTPGDTVEICPVLPPITQGISARISAHGGAALIIDYGSWRSLGDTFQAVKNHATVNPLSEPGQADLTAHVDFQALADNAFDARASAMITQGALLKRLGIQTRATHLAENLTGEALTSHQAALKRLTDDAEMGTLFKAIAIYPNGSAPPPGFDP